MTRSGPELGDVASVTQRLAVLLSAGVAPVSAWRHVAESTPSEVPTRVAASAADPAHLAEVIRDAAAGLPALEASAWRGLAAAWQVATDAGAPLASSLRDYSQSLRSLAGAQREARTALAGPVATARMVMVLPVIGVAFGALLGFDTLGTLFTTPVGWASCGIGAALMAVAARWNRRLVAAAQPTGATPGLECELLAIALLGGAAVSVARATVAGATQRFGLATDDTQIDGILELSRRAGVPAAELLRSEADEARRVAAALAQERAARLSVRLMIPLGLCVLPAFMVLGVLPLMVAVISSTVSSF